MTRRLTVRKFSVIKDATLDFCGITAIIGPQASGKSVLCKLAYFSLDIMSAAIDSASEEVQLDSFRQEIGESFSRWFPVSAWGDEKFEIRYEDGRFCASLVRTSRSGRLGDKIRLNLSPAFCSAYESALKDIRELRNRKRSKESKEQEIRPWEVRELISKRMAEMFNGRTFYQLYIPAGRALFTTYGKAIKAFQSGSLDPVTSRFGEMAEWLFSDRIYFPDRARTLIREFDEVQDRVLKGKLHYRRDTTQFETDDGRTLLLAHLSSGTQEALPLLKSLRMVLGGPSQTVFAEEPEAHLFPTAQWEIVKLFCWMSNVLAQKSCFVITTHSPYILSSFNNLIEAGQAARNNPRLRDEVAKIIPEQYWIKEGDFKAYAIENGELKSILNESGFIEANYLDQVSEVIGDEFDRLLRLEYEHTKAS